MRITDKEMNVPPPDWQPTSRQTVTVNEACTRAGVTRRTIYNWIEAGRVYYTRTASGAPRIFVESLHLDG